MVGESWDNWRDNIRRTIEMDPDSVTINIIEWNFALLLFVWYLLPGMAWRLSGFRIRYETGG